MHLEELQRLLAGGEDSQHQFKREIPHLDSLAAGVIQADTLPVPGTSVADVDWAAFDAYYRKRFNQPCPEAEHTASLASLGLLKDQQLTLAGVLLFGLQPQRWLPVCMVKAVAFYGNSIGDTQYQDSEDIDGTLSEQFQRSFAFIKRNLHHVQNGRGFNTLGELEVPPIALEELLVNALMHRDYFDSASIRLLVFRDRIEIISPGHLPGNLSTEDIQHGKTKRRNPILSEHAAHLLPYRGLGSGIHRARQAWPQIELQDHRSGNEFRAVVARPKPATQVIAPAGIGAEGTRPPVTPEVTPEVMRLMPVLQGAMSRQELMRALGLKDEKHFRQHYQQAAMALGLIEMTIPDKPRSRLQRYQLTEAGQKLVPPQQGHNP